MKIQNIRQLFFFLATLLFLFPALPVRAQTNPVEVVQSLPRMQNMVDLYEAFGSHGSFAGPYTTPGTPIDGLTSQTAANLLAMQQVLQKKSDMFGSHIGFNLAPGDWILLVGASGPVNRREPFSVTEPDGTWIEISGVFYDPRSDDFAVRLQSSYIGRGQHPRSQNDAASPIPGGALYIEASWSQLWWMVQSAEFKITSSVFETYGPNKNTNMYIAGQLFTQKIQHVTHIDVIDTIELNTPVNSAYLPWDAIVSGRVVRNVLASGVCGMVAPALNPVFRVLHATGTAYTFSGTGHSSGHKYNPTGNDPSLWLRTRGGRYFVVDSTVMSPSVNFIIDTSRPVTMKVTALIYKPGVWEEMFYITEASVK